MITTSKQPLATKDVLGIIIIFAEIAEKAEGDVSRGWKFSRQKFNNPHVEDRPRE
jgi:hypothetical protein